MQIAARTCAWGYGDRSYLHFGGWDGSNETYFSLSNIALKADTRNAAEYSALVRVSGISENKFFLDSSTSNTGSDNGFSCGLSSTGRYTGNFKLDGNSSTDKFNLPGLVNLYNLVKDRFAEIAFGFDSVTGTTCRTYCKVDGRIVESRICDAVPGIGAWIIPDVGWARMRTTSYGIGHSTSFDLARARIIVDGVVVHEFVPTAELDLLDIVGGATAVRNGDNFYYFEGGGV